MSGNFRKDDWLASVILLPDTGSERSWVIGRGGNMLSGGDSKKQPPAMAAKMIAASSYKVPEKLFPGWQYPMVVCALPGEHAKGGAQ